MSGYLDDTLDRRLLRDALAAPGPIAHARRRGTEASVRRMRAVATVALGAGTLDDLGRAAARCQLLTSVGMTAVASSLGHSGGSGALGSWARALGWGTWLPAPHRLGPHGLADVGEAVGVLAGVETYLGANGPWRRLAGVAQAGDEPIALDRAVAGEARHVRPEPLAPHAAELVGLAGRLLDEDLALDHRALDHLADGEAGPGRSVRRSAMDLEDVARDDAGLERRRRAAAAVALAGGPEAASGAGWALVAGDELAVLDALDAAEAGARHDGTAVGVARALLGVSGPPDPHWLEPGGAVLPRATVMALVAAAEVHVGLVGPYREALGADLGEDDTLDDPLWEHMLARPGGARRRGGCRGGQHQHAR